MCDDVEDEVHPLYYFFSGAFGGILAIVVSHPMDTIKTRIQVAPAPKPGKKPLYSGAFDVFLKTYKKEGIHGLYKGMGTVLCASPILFALSFMGFGVGKKLQQRYPCEELQTKQVFFAGVFSALFTSTLSVPGERIKIILQAQKSRRKTPSGFGPIQGEKFPKFSGPVDVFKRLYYTRGLQSLYLGLFATLLRDIPASGTGYTVYEMSRRYFTHHDGSIHLGWTMLSGGLAGIGACCVGLPIDIAKTKYQKEIFGTYKYGLRSVVLEIYEAHGYRGFFIGAKPTFLRTFVSNSVCFLGFEIMNRFLTTTEKAIEAWYEMIEYKQKSDDD